MAIALILYYFSWTNQRFFLLTWNGIRKWTKCSGYHDCEVSISQAMINLIRSYVPVQKNSSRQIWYLSEITGSGEAEWRLSETSHVFVWLGLETPKSGPDDRSFHWFEECIFHDAPRAMNGQTKKNYWLEMSEGPNLNNLKWRASSSRDYFLFETSVIMKYWTNWPQAGD